MGKAYFEGSVYGTSHHGSMQNEVHKALLPHPLPLSFFPSNVSIIN